MARPTHDSRYTLSMTGLSIAFGKRLQQCRAERKMTQGAVANLAGFSRVTVANFENGRQNANIFQIYCLAQALDTPMESFIPSPAEIELHSVAGMRPEVANRVSSSDMRFLEDSRALLNAMFKGDHANVFTTAD